MWSDEIDKKIRETAEGYNHPAYDDKAWDKMEVLLDKHLPTEKKRRRFILFWLLPLALVGTGLFFILQKKPTKNVAEEKSITIPGAAKSNSVPGKKDLTTKSIKTTSKSSSLQEQTTLVKPYEGQPNKDEVEKQIEKEPSLKTPVTGKINPAGHERHIVQDQRLQNENLISKRKVDKPSVSKDIAPKKNNDFPQSDKPAVNDTVIKSASGNVNDISVEPKNSAPDIVTKKNMEAESVQSNDVVTKTKTKNPKSSFGNKISLTISAGPDISSVGFTNPGKWNFQFGAGLSYAVSKRISIRAGFFTGKKIYTADSADYHSSYLPPKLQKIEANCTVYEIPLNILFNFPTIKKHNWFIAGGISSYLMKKETYDYHYKNTWGQIQVYSHTYKNENKHLFSVINLSGGYQYHFTDRIFLLAEPYTRIPVGGIGQGKVKLNSGGILFTAGFRPFFKNK
jgi:hypothetical protein